MTDLLIQTVPALRLRSGDLIDGTFHCITFFRQYADQDLQAAFHNQGRGFISQVIER